MSGSTGAGRLTARQGAFVEAFVRCGDAGKAALEAGYAPRGAKARGRNLLRNDRVRAALGAAMGDPQWHDASCEHVHPQMVTAGEGQSPPPPTVASMGEVTAEIVCLGLYREATFQGKGSSHAARVRAWECLARVRAAMDKAASEQAGQGDAAQPVVFDIRLGDG